MTPSRVSPRLRRPGLDPLILALAAVATGAYLILTAFLSALVTFPSLYGGALVGLDPPFFGVAGVVLLALAYRLRNQSRVAWFFSTAAPSLTFVTAALSPTLLSLGAAVVSLAFLGALYASRVRFYRGAMSGTEATQSAVLLGLLLSLLYGLVGARLLGGEFSPPIRGWNEALYFTVMTMSTNGTNYLPATEGARLYSVVLVVLGVGTFLSAIIAFFVPFLERRVTNVARRLERSQMEQLRNHVIVCGTSPQVRAIATSLRAAQVPFVIAGAEPAGVEALQREGFRAVLGESSSEEFLRSLSVERARALVAAEGSDAENLLTVITARGLLPDLRIVALAQEPGTVPKLKKAGANAVVNLLSVAANLIRDASLGAG